MSSIVIAGDTSGSVTLQAPAVSGSTILTLPATSGTLQTSGAGFTTNGVAYASSTSALTTGSGLKFDGTNLGIGVTPSAWTTFKVMQLGNFGAVGGVDSTSMNMFANTFYDGAFKYINTASATRYRMDGEHSWFTAPSGTAGNAITFSEGMRLTPTGLGIGTTTPDVSGWGRAVRLQGASNAAYEVTDGTVVTQLIAAAGAFGLVGTQTDHPLLFRTNNTERMRISSAGLVGIGTSSPAAVLDVNGTIYAREGATAYAAFSAVNGASGGRQYTIVSNATGSPIGDAGTFTIRDSTAGANRLSLDSSGIFTMSAYGAGAATFSASGVISSVSDETWKTKDGVPSNPDVMLQKLEPGYWYYNDEKKEVFGNERHLGFYAQNVNAAIGPEAAPEPEEGKPWGYYDRSVLAVTVMSLQKALVTIESLKARLDAANL